MTERGNRPSHGNSRTGRRTTDGVQFDYATWHDRLAAQGSRFEPDREAPSRAVRIDAVLRPVDAAKPERLAA